jgi:hypothetical protein
VYVVHVVDNFFAQEWKLRRSSVNPNREYFCSDVVAETIGLRCGTMKIIVVATLATVANATGAISSQWTRRGAAQATIHAAESARTAVIGTGKPSAARVGRFPIGKKDYNLVNVRPTACQLLLSSGKGSTVVCRASCG